MLEIESLCFAYGEKPILNGISFSVSEGEIIALIGISGSGKTTLFRLITGLIEPTEGRIMIANKAVIKGAQLNTTYMRQEDLLLPWRTVLGNLLLFTELGANKPRQKQSLYEKAHVLLNRVGLEGTAEAFPNELSGGMRQRVALARALLQNRPFMLLDEPFASLDVIIREQLYALMREIRDQYNKTILMVTHDFRDAVALADRILILSRGMIIDSCVVTSAMKEDPLAADRLIQKIRKSLSTAL